MRMYRVKIVRTFIVQVEAESKYEAIEDVREDPDFYIEDNDAHPDELRVYEPEDKIVYAGSGIIDRTASNRNET